MDPAAQRQMKIERFRRERAGKERLQVWGGMWRGVEWVKESVALRLLFVFYLCLNRAYVSSISDFVIINKQTKTKPGAERAVRKAGARGKRR